MPAPCAFSSKIQKPVVSTDSKKRLQHPLMGALDRSGQLYAGCRTGCCRGRRFRRFLRRQTLRWRGTWDGSLGCQWTAGAWGAGRGWAWSCHTSWKSTAAPPLQAPPHQSTFSRPAWLLEQRLWLLRTVFLSPLKVSVNRWIQPACDSAQTCSGARWSGLSAACFQPTRITESCSVHVWIPPSRQVIFSVSRVPLLRFLLYVFHL